MMRTQCPSMVTLIRSLDSLFMTICSLLCPHILHWAGMRFRSHLEILGLLLLLTTEAGGSRLLMLMMEAGVSRLLLEEVGNLMQHQLHLLLIRFKTNNLW